MTNKGPLEDKSYKFALEVIRICKIIISNNKEYILTKQCIRSATSIGANVSEAQQCESRRDFICKLAISAKEAYETRYWLFLLRDSNNLDEKFTQQSLQSVDEIIRMLVSSIKTAKRNL